jgi:long-chain acyl-CoA synthetase
MERLNVMACLIKGVKCDFISGDIRTTLAADIEILKPTIFVNVPRVLHMFREKIIDSLKKLPEGCKKNLALKALRTKRENFKTEGRISHLIYDKLIFSKISEKIGGKIKCFITGSAPSQKSLLILSYFFCSKSRSLWFN